jgi:peroxiredoxin
VRGWVDVIREACDPTGAATSEELSMLRTALHPLLVFLLGWAAQGLADEIVSKPQEVRPLLIGAQAPAHIVLHTVDGQATTLAQAMQGKPSLLVFFRGGWCPYCDLQLSELRLIESDLASLGYAIIAISPDEPRALKVRGEKNALGYTLLSDASAELTRAFGIAYRVELPPSVVATAGSTRVLPVTSIYMLDTQGAVQFQYVNPDYRVRVPKELMLAAAKAALQTAK